MLLIKYNVTMNKYKCKKQIQRNIPSFWKVLCCHVEGIVIMFM